MINKSEDSSRVQLSHKWKVEEKKEFHGFDSRWQRWSKLRETKVVRLKVPNPPLIHITCEYKVSYF